VALAGCGDEGTGPQAGVDLDPLFAAPSASELAAVRADWAARDPAPADVRVESTQQLALGAASATVRVLSHAIAGGRHYGAVVQVGNAPAGSLPVVVYLHGGAGGAAVDELLLLSLALGDAFGSFVWVVPSFRSEPLQVRGTTYRSGGSASPWDRDVDDAIALLGAALATTPAADPARVGTLGFSRGGGVALLMGIRDRRVDRVVSFSGPTDFLGGDIRALMEDAIEGELPSLPGLDALDRTLIRPFAEGALPLAQARLELVRRSPVLFADQLPATQLHHGTADPVVAVSQAERLIAELRRLGRGTPPQASPGGPTPDEWYLYEGAGHDPLALAGAVGRTTRFLSALTVR